MKTNKKGIVVFAFGKPSTILSNQWLAHYAIMEAIKFRVKNIFTQIDILIDDEDVLVDYIHQEDDCPPPTMRIARAAVRWAKENEIYSLKIIAAKPHMWRCERDVKYAIKESGSSLNLETYIPNIPDKEWYNPDSEQIRTRSEKDWEKREEILKYMPMWLYKLIAS